MQLKRRTNKRSSRAMVVAMLCLMALVVACLFLLPPFQSASAAPAKLQTKAVHWKSLVPLTDREREAFAHFSIDTLQSTIDALVSGGKVDLVLKATQNQAELIKQLTPNDDLEHVLLVMLARRSHNNNGGKLLISQDIDFQNRVLSHLTNDRQLQLTKDMEMDTDNIWIPIPDDILAMLEYNGLNPLNRNCTKTNLLHVPDHEGKYAGLTSDMGWILMNAMFALETGNCVEFPDQWGHGCHEEDKEASWTCMFKPIQPFQTQQEVKRMSGRIAEVRKMVRRDDLYGREFTGHRYPKLAQWIYTAATQSSSTPQFELRDTADLLAFRLVFRWVFRITDQVQQMIDDIQKEILQGFKPEDIASAHLRFGDKLGLKPGPKEAHQTYQVRDFAERLVLYYKQQQVPFPKALFVATDDFSACEALSRYLGNSVRILTSAKPEKDTGFSIVEYRTTTTAKDRFNSVVRLWADMDILAKAEVFLGSFQSNVGRMVHLMRFSKPAATTISVDPSPAKCTASNRKNQIASHNFWYCP